MRREVEKRVYEVFERAIQKLKNPKDIRNFVDDLLTPTEKIMLSKRLAIAVLLEKGLDYRQISGIMKVSFATITSIVRQRSLGGLGYKKVVGEILKEEKSEESFLEFEKWVSKFLSHPSRHGKIDARVTAKKFNLNKREV